MGAAVIELAAADTHWSVAARIIPPGETGGVLLDAVDPVGVDVMIDFSERTAVQAHAAWCASHGICWVLGTTGLTAEDDAAVQRAAGSIVVFRATNYSLGVALLTDLASRAARVLGLKTDVEIVESHHHHKQDAPSGTAMTLGKAVANARGQVLGDVAVDGRSGMVGARPKGEIGMHALRLADVVGRHEVHFGWPMEGLVLTHEARDRRVFVAGALTAGRFAHGIQAAGRTGLVGMRYLVEETA
jgi:4-hydroxy-tetrahydrodipicolinate reductase